MDFPYIFTVDAIEGVPSTDLIGGKCYQLTRLSHLQLPIPRWFCITTNAFEHFLSANGIPIPAQFEINSDIQAIRQLVIEASLPDQLGDEIAVAAGNILHTSESGAVVVRSSATMEDASSAAFAGQFDTFLGITDIETLLLKVKKCWASLWSDRAVRYWLRQGYSGRPAMAVMVQHFVPAEVSGVMFTANPANKHRDEMIIEASWGLGEMVVGGKVIPDHFLIKKSEGGLHPGVVSAKLGSKRRSLQWNANERCLEEQLNLQEQQRSRTLNDEQLVQLSRLGLRLESYFDCPQDIEWAKYQECVYLLQSRPITTL